MQDLRDLECLIALARYRHFARAAESCGLSQPAFSMRIRSLEDRLDIKIVKRGNRFEGLTREGETVLRHAREIVERVRTMEQDLRATPGQIVGVLTVGMIPTAGAYAARVARRLAKQHPGIRTRLMTAPSLVIQQGVDNGQFDVGFTYAEGAPADLLHVLPLYDERYVLLLPEALAAGHADAIPWEDAARMPLILLEAEMQNRRIIDRLFREIGAQPRVVAETNGFMAAALMASEGMGATIIPAVLQHTMAAMGGVVALPLVKPELSKSVCLVSRRSDSQVPVVTAIRALLASEAR